MGRRGTINRWLLAAGCLALVGCRTEVGEEESSSWFNFTSRPRGGGHGGTGSNPAHPEPGKPRPDRVSEAWNEPNDPPRDASAKPADSLPTSTQRTPGPKSDLGQTGTSLPLPTGTAPLERRESATLPLPAIQDGTSEARARRPGPTVTIPEASVTSGRAADPRRLDVDGAPRADRKPGGLELTLPEGPAKSPRDLRSLALTVPANDAVRPSRSEGLDLPDVPGPTTPRKTGSSLRLPGFDAPSAGEPRTASPLDRDLPGPPGSSRIGERLDLPALPAGATSPRTPTRLPIDWDGLATQPDGSAGQATSRPLGAVPAGAPPVNDPLPGFRPTTAEPAPRGEGGPSSPIPGLRPETSARARKTSARPGVTVARGPDAGERGATTEHRLDIAMDALDPRAAATAQPLPPVPNARPVETRIPLPFRLSEWISDEQQHRLWRQQHLERAQLEPVERQAEQDRLREALLKWLTRDPAAR